MKITQKAIDMTLFLIAINLLIYSYVQFASQMFRLIINIVENKAVEICSGFHISQFGVNIKLSL